MKANEVISVALKEHKNPVVGFSGGKDSTAVLSLVRSINPNIKGVFCNTGVEAKSTYEYIKRVPSIVWLTPEKTFWELVEEYGFPTIKGKGKSRVNHCCEWLKDRPMKKYIKENNIDLLFDGLTIAESHQRFMFLKHYGKYHYVKTWKVWKCHPIAEWGEDQVWEYIRNNNLDYNKGYDHGMVRCGCQPCTAYKSWTKRLSKENFKLYEYVQKLRGQSLLDKYSKNPEC